MLGRSLARLALVDPTTMDPDRDSVRRTATTAGAARFSIAGAVVTVGDRLLLTRRPAGSPGRPTARSRTEGPQP